MDEEKKIIYALMREIVEERRELSKQYYDLKVKLDTLSMTSKINKFKEHESTKNEFLDKQENKFKKKISYSKKRKYYPFERIAGYVVEILKSSEYPIRSKELFDQLINEYDVHILYNNFSNNILPRIMDSNNFSVEKVGRGYWQYKSKRK
ncbi:TPA: hypothetical protein NGF98_000860 [Enterococcus faecalis]|uniref:hypothetical protein n=1 Tax=Enterococcus TaxID=1350 RepID=UPI00100E9188|nr:hypothetical protein [Enterococcus faecalis]EGO2739276.1 hypothetical protein [Enterococcus faecalis]EGO9476301.1 hypothetical protein [Enterococcus faecalis]EGS1163701.1 hypothetical protein [Enterococcus faecalis]EHG5966450.1 hypothetical protein [Enterococcus faecalis]EHV2903951.1 hypothetical protein [Enterococcus faecalis]